MMRSALMPAPSQDRWSEESMRKEARATLAEYDRNEDIDAVLAEAKARVPNLDQQGECRFGIEIICAANRISIRGAASV